MCVSKECTYWEGRQGRKRKRSNEGQKWRVGRKGKQM